MQITSHTSGYIWNAVLTLVRANREEHHHPHHLTDSIMKTLCLTLGLLLLIACCCTAMPKALKFSTAPGSCCFSFCTHRLPLKRVSTITKTHSSCRKPAFIVQTIMGRQICYSQTFQWALDVYNRLHNTEATGLQP